jgi:hypothetical protein
MTTVVNNPGGSDGSGVGTVIGIIVVVVLLIILVVYGLPALRGGAAPANPGANINVTLPAGSGAPGGAAE